MKSVALVMWWGALVSIGLAQSAEKFQPAIARIAPTQWQLSWSGETNYTFFPQHSPNRDLMSFTFMPIQAYIAGAGPQIFVVDSNPETFPKGFYGLKYTDLDPDNLAGDGIPALYKINVLGIDPFTKNLVDTDGDGLSDAWERFYFDGLDVANPGGVGSPDGLTNSEKDDLGLDPNVDYLAATATQNTGYLYDPVGRLTRVTGTPAAADFTPDEEGNLLNTH